MDNTTMGTRCALCGNYYTGAHACVSPREVEPIRFLHPSLEHGLLLQILEELKAIRAKLEAAR